MTDAELTAALNAAKRVVESAKVFQIPDHNALIACRALLAAEERHRAELAAKDAEIARLREACLAAIRYDDSICGRAARGEYDLRESGGGIATGDDLDALYEDWINKARAVLARQPESPDERG